MLDASGGNKTKAAKTLDIDYKTLLTKLKSTARPLIWLALTGHILTKPGTLISIRMAGLS